MHKIRSIIFATLFAMTAGGIAGTVALPSTAAAACAETETRILTIPPWYRGMLDGSCNVKNPDSVGGISNFVWRIVLNVVEMLLHVIGYVAAGFIIWGGFQYLISTGSPDKITAAKKTIMNAVIGLLISIFSIGIVNVVVGAFK